MFQHLKLSFPRRLVVVTAAKGDKLFHMFIPHINILYINTAGMVYSYSAVSALREGKRMLLPGRKNICYLVDIENKEAENMSLYLFVICLIKKYFVQEAILYLFCIYPIK